MKSPIFHGLIASLIFAASLPTLHADLKATDGDVPSTIDAGGTAEDPALYIMGTTPGYTASPGRVIVGWDTPYNSLVVQGGAHIEGAMGLVSGARINANYNSVLLTGSSSWNLNDGDLSLGIIGSYNTIRIEDGSSVTNAFLLVMGDANGKNNSLTISGMGSYVQTWGGFFLGGTGNTVTLDNSGLLRIDATFAGDNYIGPDNYFQFSGGYFAWEGDRAATINTFVDSGKFKAWNGTEFVNVTSEHVTLNYYDTDAAGLAATGIDGLGGYTVATATAVPEPSTWVLIGAGAIGVAAGMRRKRLATVR